MHEQELGARALPHLAEHLGGRLGLPQLGVRLGQPEDAGRPQTRCHPVGFDPGQCLVQLLGGRTDVASHQLGRADHEHQIRIRQARHVLREFGE
ncbi:hypothetical protein [Mycolicibacterium chitae]|uniref:hypothetical protein n=1 Tax=Mycolicibacterium chitae TaxID=1792 RepID=UPI0014776EC3|nr:hypothetical protein [Mycolicibacterium chitae]